MNTTIKIDVVIDLDKVRKALKDRHIAINESNVKKFLKLMTNGSFGGTDKMYNEQPLDKEVLLMYGFTFEKLS